MNAQTSNRNVPASAQVFGEKAFCSGEIRYAYFVERYEPAHPIYGHWSLWKVCDWVGSQPEAINLKEIEAAGLLDAYQASFN